MRRLVILLCFLGAAGADKTFRPGQNDKCSIFCKDTYAAHTIQESNSVKACDQGCSLFSVLQFSGGNDVSGVRSQCSDACAKALGDNQGLKDACQAGCKQQAPFTNGHMEIVIDNKSPLFGYAQDMFDGVFDRMRNMHQHMMNGFRNMWSDQSPSMVKSPEFQSMDEDMSKMHEEMQSMMEKFWNHPRNQQGGMMGDDVMMGNQRPSMIINIDDHDRSGTLPSLDEKPHEPSPPIDVRQNMAYEADTSWVACLARRARHLSWMTRWLLCVALLLCALCMLWICLAIIRTAPRRRLLVTKGDGVQICAGGPLPEKKFLSESGAAPLVHNSPPPPYEEESETKEPIDT